jgi:hypothetical protein
MGRRLPLLLRPLLPAALPLLLLLRAGATPRGGWAPHTAPPPHRELGTPQPLPHVRPRRRFCQLSVFCQLRAAFLSVERGVFVSLSAEDLRPTALVALRDRWFVAPSSTQKILTGLYGWDWETPDRAHDHHPITVVVVMMMMMVMVMVMMMMVVVRWCRLQAGRRWRGGGVGALHRSRRLLVAAACTRGGSREDEGRG